MLQRQTCSFAVREIAAAVADGQLWEAAIDAKGKDRAPRLLLQLLDNAEAVRSVRLEPLPLPGGGDGGQLRLLVMVATQSR